MIPASIDSRKPLTRGVRDLPGSFKSWIRRYFWLWVAYQTAKGIATTTLLWAPLIYMYWME